MHRTTSSWTAETPTSQHRMTSAFKRDHPRSIDRFIDYFGTDDRGHSVASTADHTTRTENRSA